MPVLKQNQVFAGRYVLKQLIGEGGFSEVWKASDQMADDAVVAIKIYAPEKGLDDYGLRQFRNEFSITYNLSHPHLLKVSHFDIADGSPYLIMPYCPYGSLTTLLQREGIFSERQVALVMCQIGAALEEVHRQSPPIVHQDIKPDNILLLHPESFMLADFGISSRIRNTIKVATDNMQTLTIAYAPPERFDRHPTSVPSSDIFALGVTLYEMCTNTVPWDGAGGQCLLKGANIPALPDTFSKELNSILEACMSADRTQRPTAREIHLRGRQYLETGQWRMPGDKKKSNILKKAVVSTLVAATLVLAALAGLWWYNGELPSSAEELAQVMNTASLLERNIVQEADKQLVSQKETEDVSQPETKKQAAKPASKVQVADRQPAEVPREETREEEPIEMQQEEIPAVQVAKKPQPTSQENNLAKLSGEMQQYLNQISDPANSRAVRSGWKQETLARFADGSVRVLDESDGAIKEYRAGIFLTLLLTSPHQVVVREIKTDQNNKITELRLTKQPISSSM